MQRMFSRGVPRDIASGRRGFSQIPVIDVSALVQSHSSAQDQQEAAAALHEAARRVGFFYAANTGVPADLCSNILTQARQWFDLPVGSLLQRVDASGYTVLSAHALPKWHLWRCVPCRKRQSSRLRCRRSGTSEATKALVPM